ncbi:YitT family protein [Azohydromonas caseinilytica]|uniref:YitT family protein n=1 Tax=Azohydromonas caseinilytica TaxID=2728836 RepID=A0A848FGV1_9BURK|nr:YitT family protein [Azohydromonas caseinilytica]NML18688.1 YitT family protein [Azohydromonas caseinilytica]
MHSPSRALLMHRHRDDLMALLTGALFLSLGLVLFRKVGLLTGGTAGLAFLGHYASGWSFGTWFFVINLPFYALAWQRKGAEFTLKTLVSVSAISVLSDWLPRWIAIAHVEPLYAAVMGGTLMGCGMLVLFRHQASVGGLGILALVLQERGKVNAGTFQMAVDALIVLAALAVADLRQVALSILGAVMLNLVLALNHRPGRYMAA